MKIENTDYLSGVVAKQVELQREIAKTESWKVWRSVSVAAVEKFLDSELFRSALKGVGFVCSGAKILGNYNSSIDYSEDIPKIEVQLILDMVGQMKPTGKSYGNRQYDAVASRMRNKENRFKDKVGVSLQLNQYSMEERSVGVLASLWV